MVKNILKELVKWFIITLIIGSIIWTTSSLYKFIKKHGKGSLTILFFFRENYTGYYGNKLKLFSKRRYYYEEKY